MYPSPSQASQPSVPKVLPADRVRVNAAPQVVGMPHANACGQPSIRLVEQNGTVRAIDVTCCCGEQFRLLCDYQ